MQLYSKQLITTIVLCCTLAGCGGSSSDSADKNDGEGDLPSRITVTTTVGEGGSISPDSIDVQIDESGSFEIVANEGYFIESASGCNGALDSTTYTTSAIAETCSVDVLFSRHHNNLAPIAEVLFPWSVSRTEESSITVRGIASDPDGIAAIRVNGIVASLQPTTIAPDKTNKFSIIAKTDSVLGLNDSAANKAVDKSSTQITWQATLEISKVNLDIIVETEDLLGNKNTAADSVNIISYDVPTSFTIDHVHNRLIGSNGFNSLVSINLAEKQIAEIPLVNINHSHNLDVNSKLSYLEAQDSLIYSSIMGGTLSISSVDIETGIIATLIHYELNYGIGWEWAHIEDMDVSSDGNAAFMLLQYFPEKNGNMLKSVLLKYDLITGNMSTVADASTTSGKTVYGDGRGLAYTPSGLLTFGDNSTLLEKVALNGSDLSQIGEPTDLWGQAINVDGNTAYLTAYGGITKVDLETGIQQDLSLEENETELNISQIRSTGLDLLNNKLLIADSDLDIIMSVDMESGVRDVYLDTGVGTGRKMVYPRGLAFDETKNIVYIVDDGGNGPEVVLSIDLNTGNRTQVSNINNQYNVDVHDIVLDHAAQQLYIRSDGILRIDIETQTTTVFSSGSIGTGVNLGDFWNMALDKANNRLVIPDMTLNALVGIDLTTGHRSIISMVDVGIGENFSIPVDVTIDAKNNQALVLSRGRGAVFSVDLSNGNREILLDTCLGADLQDKLNPGEWELTRLNFNEEKRQLLIVAKSLLNYDIDNDTCISSNSWKQPLDIVLTNNNQILATEPNTLVLLDFDSGDSVIISK